MGMDLCGAGGEMSFNGIGWRATIEIGELYGWEPIGTGPPPGCPKKEWEVGGPASMRTYYTNDGARFYARDASCFAVALRRALDDRSRARQRATAPILPPTGSSPTAEV